MPTFTIPLQEFNFCHLPAGSARGGQFCSDAPWAQSSTRVTKSRRATTGAMRAATDKERKRMAIPPAYTDAQITTNPKAELRATAVDAKGRTHYYYSSAYLERQQGAKWTRVVAMHRELPTLLAKLDAAIAKGPGKPGYHEALTLRLIAQTGFRNGGEATGEEDTYGASSLRMAHVTTDGETLRFTFPGKGGVRQSHTLRDPVLVTYAESRKGHETLFPHTADDTYAYMQEVTRGRFKVHDLRTWMGTTLADRFARELVTAGHAPTTPKAFKAFRKVVAEKVSDALGNTAAVALKSYIHPLVFKPWEP